MNLLRDNNMGDIQDDEIRIISSEKKKEKLRPIPLEKIDPKYESSSLSEDEEDSIPEIKWKWWSIITAVIFIGGLCVFFWWEVSSDKKEELKYKNEEIRIKKEQSRINNYGYNSGNVTPTAIPSNIEKGYVETKDTMINKVALTIYKPKNLTPKLHIGIDALSDTVASFVVQAADIRRDNGQIVGAYVSEGDLLSRGKSKAGFCAIINGKLIIGVADSTPYLEQAIETGGYFFRQYPLVVGGQAVDNKLKSSSLRKALAELNGEIVVIMNDKKQTLNEFSQTLVDLGVSNAIYLVGSTAPGFAIDGEGNRIDFGKNYETPSVNSNYIIWQ